MSREKQLFDLVHTLWKIQQTHFHIFHVVGSDRIHYWVDCRDKGSFEITRLRRIEDFEPHMDDRIIDAETL